VTRPGAEQPRNCGSIPDWENKKDFSLVHTDLGVHPAFYYGGIKISSHDVSLVAHFQLLLKLLASRLQYLFDKCLLLYVQSWTPDDGRKDRPKHVDCHSKIKYIWYIGASGWFYYRNNTALCCLTRHADCYSTLRTFVGLARRKPQLTTNRANFDTELHFVPYYPQFTMKLRMSSTLSCNSYP